MIRGVLKRLFDYAMTAGLNAINPVMALPMRHVHRARSRDRALAPQLILLTPVRKSELMLACWEHVDVEKAEWHIPAENSKTGKPHIVYLSLQALALFAELRSLAGGQRAGAARARVADQAVCAQRDEQCAEGGAVRPGHPAFTIHDLRRTASTLLH
jgi:integrase